MCFKHSRDASAFALRLFPCLSSKGSALRPKNIHIFLEYEYLIHVGMKVLLR